ncbi:LOW QUALITY PROTEIN: RNA-binding protein 45-like [Erethizon dorsatum]
MFYNSALPSARIPASGSGKATREEWLETEAEAERTERAPVEHDGRDQSGGVSGFRPGVDSLDEPPNSRIFLVISKYTPEAVLRERFSPFGEIQDIWVVRDKHTKESKGIAFIKFARSSQACRAMEEMHGQCLEPNNTKPIKVRVPGARCPGRASPGCSATVKEGGMRLTAECTWRGRGRGAWGEDPPRPAVLVGQAAVTSSIYSRPEKNLLSGRSIRERVGQSISAEQQVHGVSMETRSEEAGLASRIEWAGKRREQCFRAVLAEPKNTSESSEQDYYSNKRQGVLGHEPTVNIFPFDQQSEFPNFDNDNRGQEAISKRVSVVSRVPFTEEQLFSISDIVPGLEYCEVQQDPESNYSHGVVQYFNVASAIYAKYKLHGFQYPPGNRIGVSFIDDGSNATDLLRKMATQMVAAQLASVVWDNPSRQQFLQQFGGGSGSQLPQIQTDVILPSCKKKADPETPVDPRYPHKKKKKKERLFIVFNPHPLPLGVLEDIFCRFGNLIEVYLVSGKNVGYAKFADRMSANDAISTLHGKILNGVRLKVMLADSPKEESNKRQRTY